MSKVRVIRTKNYFKIEGYYVDDAINQNRDVVIRVGNTTRSAILSYPENPKVKTRLTSSQILVTYELEFRTGIGLKRVSIEAEGSTGSRKKLFARIYCVLGKQQQQNYSDWITRVEQRQPKAEAPVDGPLISILLPVYNTPEKWLHLCINSVLKQTYKNWELCIANDASTEGHIKPVLGRYTELDQRIKIIHRPNNGHISLASNSALNLAEGSYCALLDHDDELAPHALAEICLAIRDKPNAVLLYSDEDKIDSEGRRSAPYFKSDWDPFLFLGHNLITHFCVIKKSALDSVGGFRVGFEGAQDYDLFARITASTKSEDIVHIPKILYHWRTIQGSTALSSNEKPYAISASLKAVNQHLARLKISGRVKVDTKKNRHILHIDTPAKEPMVSILIPTKNNKAILKRCIDSIVKKTTYKSFEIIIIDNGSDEEECLTYLENLEQCDRIRLLRDNAPFNYSALNNLAARSADSDYLLLLNDDTEVISPNWIDSMLSLASLEQVGAVGAKLWYPNGTLQHGGVILGPGGLAAHAFTGLKKGTVGYHAKSHHIQRYSAVTGACMMVNTELYHRVGGLNEDELKVAYNDIDFCLKLHRLGFYNLWTPHAELYHHESYSRGYEDTPEKLLRFEGEKRYMREHWGDIIENDPCYNPNLTRDGVDFSLRF